MKEQVGNPDSDMRRRLDDVARTAKEKSMGALNTVKDHVESNDIVANAKQVAAASLDAVSPYVADGMRVVKYLTKGAAASVITHAPSAIRHGAAQVIWLSICGSSPCANGGKCVLSERSEDEYTCQCQDGFSGINCETRPLFVEAAALARFINARTTGAILIGIIGVMAGMRHANCASNANCNPPYIGDNKPKKVRRTQATVVAKETADEQLNASATTKVPKGKPRATSRSPSPAPPKRASS